MAKTRGIWRGIIIGLSLIIACAATIHAQDPSLKRGNEAYESMAYPEAARHYEKVLKKQFNKTALLRLAECYRLTHEYEKAIAAYEKVVKINQIPAESYFHYAQSLMISGDYEQAQTWFLKFAEIAPDDPRGGKFAASCTNISSYFKDTSEYELIEFKYNSQEADFGPAWYGEGMIFASSRDDRNVSNSRYEWTGQPFLDLYFANFKEVVGAFSRPRPLRGKLNTKYHEATCSVDDENNLIYYTRNGFFTSRKKSRTGIANLKIFYADLSNSGWKNIRGLPFNSDEYSVGHPALSKDGKRLFFISDLPGGEGGTDIYYADKRQDSWSKPVNLGSAINTPGNEMFPWIHPDGTLYFASDGHGGLGGLDVFMSSVEGDGVLPVNLGSPVNSPYDDFGIITSHDRQWGIFSSNRPGGKGSDDLYIYKMLKPRLAALILDKQTGMPITEARVLLTISGTVRQKATESGDDGSLSFVLEQQSNYQLSIRADQYRPLDYTFTSFGLGAGETQSDTFYLERPSTRASVKLLDMGTGFPITDAKVKVMGTKLFFESDSSGTFDLYVDPYPDYRGSENECHEQESPEYCYRFWDEGAMKTDSMPLIYEWDLGDGNRQRGLEIRHCYDAPGTYVVQLNLIDTTSGFLFLNQSTYDLEVRPPQHVYIACPDTVTRGHPIDLDASASVLPGCKLRAFQWEINGEPAGGGPVLPYTFPKTGSYQIQLEVSGAESSSPLSCGDCVTRTVVVKEAGWQRSVRDSLREAWAAPPKPPVEDVLCPPQDPEDYCFRFSDRGAAPSDSIPFVYEWDMGDGVRLRGEEVFYCYDHPGKYKVRLEIRDPFLDKTLYTQAEYELDVRDLKQVYIESFDTIRPGEQVQLNAFKSDAKNCNVKSVYWDFGDGESATGPETRHAYEQTGTYRLRMVLSGNIPGTEAKCEECTYKEINVADGYRSREVRDSIRETKQRSDEKLDPSQAYVLEISKPGYTSKMLKLQPVDTGFVVDTILLRRNEEEVVLAGIATETGSEKPLTGVRLKLIDKRSGNVLREVELKDGKFSVPVPAGISFILVAEKSGYLTYRQDFKPFEPGKGGYNLRLPLEPIELGKPIVLKNIYYDYSKSHIRHAAAFELKKLSLFLLDNPEITIELSSHTDARGLHSSNLILSQQRAQRAVDFLVALGVPRKRIVARGYGEQRLANRCEPCSENQHQLNRRTEMKIIGFRDPIFSKAIPMLENNAPETSPVVENLSRKSIRRALMPVSGNPNGDSSWFSIQLGLWEFPQQANRFDALGAYDEVLIESRKGELYLYRLGESWDYAQMEKHLKIIRNRGYEHAAIIQVARKNPRKDLLQTRLPEIHEGQLFFAVQIGVHGRSTPPAFFKKLDEYRSQVWESPHGTLRRVNVFRLRTSRMALKYQGILRKRGYTDAFIVAYFDGKRIDIDKAKDMEK